MKKIIILLTLITSSAVFAISDDNLLNKCKGVAATQILKKAEGLNCKLREDNLEPAVLENEFFNPVKKVEYRYYADCEIGFAILGARFIYSSITKKCQWAGVYSY